METKNFKYVYILIFKMSSNMSEWTLALSLDVCCTVNIAWAITQHRDGQLQLPLFAVSIACFTSKSQGNTDRYYAMFFIKQIHDLQIFPPILLVVFLFSWWWSSRHKSFSFWWSPVCLFFSLVICSFGIRSKEIIAKSNIMMLPPICFLLRVL